MNVKFEIIPLEEKVIKPFDLMKRVSLNSSNDLQISDWSTRKLLEIDENFILTKRYNLNINNLDILLHVSKNDVVDTEQEILRWYKNFTKLNPISIAQKWHNVGYFFSLGMQISATSCQEVLLLIDSIILASGGVLFVPFNTLILGDGIYGEDWRNYLKIKHKYSSPPA